MTVFHTNCTLPTDGTHFVTAPNSRGTLDIVWNCLTLILLSTWSILHLNVPTQSSPEGTSQKYTRKAVRFFGQVKWMLVNVLAPEWALGKAWSDYQSASTLEKDFTELQEVDGVPWSRTHTYFANMGGFAIYFTAEAQQPEPDASEAGSGHTSASIGNQEGHEHTKAPDDSGQTTIVSIDVSQDVIDTAQDPGLSTGKSTSAQVQHMLASHQRDPGEKPTGQVGKPDSQTEVDEEKGGSRGEVLPSYIQNYFQAVQRRRFLSVESIFANVQRLSCKIGRIAWAPDDANTRAVSEALRIINPAHFKTKLERSRFLDFYTNWVFNIHALQGDIWILDASQLLVARRLGIIAALPSISNDEIDDRNKGDVIVKILAVGQMLWFFIEKGARLAFKLPTSQLEIVVFAFSICTAITYLLLLDKPKDASTSVPVRADRHPTSEEMIEIAIAGPVTWSRYRRTIWIPNNAFHLDSKRSTASLARMQQGCGVALIIFGAVHCIAWDFNFPTQPEKILWRVCSVVTITVIPLGLLYSAVVSRVWRAITKEEGRPMGLKISIASFFVPLALVFLLCRLFIIVEVFRSLITLPSEVFKTTWSANLPHYGG